MFDVISELHSTSTPGICAVADADFDAHEGRGAPHTNVFWCDSGDVESMLVRSSAFDAVIHELADEVDPCTAREELVAAAFPIAAIRAVSHAKGLKLLFSNLEPKRILTGATFTTDLRKLVRWLQGTSRRGVLDIDDIIRQARLVMHWSSSDRLALCRGHDLTRLMSYALQGRWAHHAEHEVRPEKLERFLRLAYTRDEFAGTGLWKHFDHWRSLNRRYRVV